MAVVHLDAACLPACLPVCLLMTTMSTCTGTCMTCFLSSAQLSSALSQLSQLSSLDLVPVPVDLDLDYSESPLSILFTIRLSPLQYCCRHHPHCLHYRLQILEIQRNHFDPYRFPPKTPRSFRIPLQQRQPQVLPC